MAMQLSQLHDLRVRFAGDVRAFELSAKETLLLTWIALGGHGDHLEAIRRVIQEGTPEGTERYRCFQCSASIDLCSATTMEGTKLKVTVTPTVSA